MFLNSVGKVDVQVRRDIVGGQYVDGVWQAAEQRVFCIKANVQRNPALNRMNRLSEGDKSREAIAIYCKDELFMAKEGAAKRKADVVSFDDALWEVKIVYTYKMGVLDHCEAIAVKLDDV